MTRKRSSRKPLTGRVALVAGATRGAGRGVARALAEAGALVYCTGRSVSGKPSPYGRPETIDETAAMITAAGGTAIAVRVDPNFLQSESPLFVGRAIAALAADAHVGSRTGMLCSSWERAREFGLTDYDGRRPDWGRHKIDFSVLPTTWVDLFRTGASLEIEWLTTLAARTRKFKAKIPESRPKPARP